VRHPDAPAPGEVIGSHDDRCFGCGSGQPHGLHLEVQAGDGVSVTARLTVLPAHQGAPGLAHGGVLAAALDEALGALGWLQRVIGVTGRLETDFARPVPVGSVLHIGARVTAVHGRKIYAEATGRLGGPEGEVAVRAEALFIEVTADHFEHGMPAGIRAAAVAEPDQAEVARAFEGEPVTGGRAADRAPSPRRGGTSSRRTA
jgi:acyl-coenzyme A thioesterase PaaI-like protein